MQAQLDYNPNKGGVQTSKPDTQADTVPVYIPICCMCNETKNLVILRNADGGRDVSLCHAHARYWGVI